MTAKLTRKELDLIATLWECTPYTRNGVLEKLIAHVRAQDDALDVLLQHMSRWCEDCGNALMPDGSVYDSGEEEEPLCESCLSFQAAIVKARSVRLDP